MNKNDKQVLKNFISKVKIPKIFYVQNQIELIDIHMIVLSQIDLILHNKIPNISILNLISKNDEKTYALLAKKNSEVMSYLNNLKDVIQIIKNNE